MADQRPRPGFRRAVLMTAAVTVLTLLPATAQAVDRGAVVSIPVAFQVTDTNTSRTPCPSDGARYTVRGHLTGPRAALTSRRATSATVYLYGEEAGEWNWHLTSMPAYDHAAEMAKLGHVS